MLYQHVATDRRIRLGKAREGRRRGGGKRPVPPLPYMGVAYRNVCCFQGSVSYRASSTGIVGTVHDSHERHCPFRVDIRGRECAVVKAGEAKRRVGQR